MFWQHLYVLFSIDALQVQAGIGDSKLVSFCKRVVNYQSNKYRWQKKKEDPGNNEND